MSGEVMTVEDVLSEEIGRDAEYREVLEIGTDGYAQASKDFKNNMDTLNKQVELKNDFDVQMRKLDLEEKRLANEARSLDIQEKDIASKQEGGKIDRILKISELGLSAAGLIASLKALKVYHRSDLEPLATPKAASGAKDLFNRVCNTLRIR